MAVVVVPWRRVSRVLSDVGDWCQVVEYVADRAVVAREQVIDVGRRIERQLRLVQLTDEVVETERSPATTATDGRSRRRSGWRLRVNGNYDQRVIRQHQRLNFNGPRFIPVARHEDIELVVACMCRLPDTVMQTEVSQQLLHSDGVR